jgi:hypothetical protein
MPVCFCLVHLQVQECCMSGQQLLIRWQQHKKMFASGFRRTCSVQLESMPLYLKNSEVKVGTHVFACPAHAGVGVLHDRPAAADSLAAAQECVQALLSRRGGTELLLAEQPRWVQRFLHCKGSRCSYRVSCAR